MVDGQPQHRSLAPAVFRFVNMFEVATHDPSKHSVEFTRVTGGDGTLHVKGGWQGGRGWQVNASAINSTASDPHDCAHAISPSRLCVLPPGATQRKGMYSFGPLAQTCSLGNGWLRMCARRSTQRTSGSSTLLRDSYICGRIGLTLAAVLRGNVWLSPWTRSSRSMRRWQTQRTASRSSASSLGTQRM